MASSKKKEDSDYVEFFKDMVKNWKILLPCLFIAGVVGVFVALWIRPVYKVDALLQIETKNNKNMGMMAGLGSLFATASPAETEIELIMSRQIIGEAVEKMHLQYDAEPLNKLDRLLHREGRMEVHQFEVPWSKLPAEETGKPWFAVAKDSVTFDLLDHNGKKVLTGTPGQTYRTPYAGDTVSFSVYSMEVKPGQKFAITKKNRLNAIGSFKGAFSVKEKGKKTGILEFSYQDIYPDRATTILNEIATTYLRQNVEQRNAEAQKTLEFLEKQLPEVKAQMDSSLLKFNTYRNKVGSVDINAETRLVLENRTKLQQDLLALQQKKQSAIRPRSSPPPSRKFSSSRTKWKRARSCTRRCSTTSSS